MARFPELIERSVVITGAARGIGAAIAQRFADEGARVVIGDVDEAGADQLVRSLVDAGRQAVAVGCDVTDRDQVAHLFETAIQEYGGVDILVNNAGIAIVEPLMEADERSWEAQIAVNAKGVFFCSQAAARVMQNQGRGGRIIVNASGAGRTSPGAVPLGVYAASKHAAVGLTRAFADELAPDRILVNCVCAGIVDTEMWDLIDRKMTSMSGEEAGSAVEQAVATIPLGRIQRPSDVADVVLLLASDEAGYVTGQALSADGGLLKI
ncbi:MAG: glucose 1-dehydrogenase [Proteobacteria bacterium]|nr:glucose 1-dehydrogenase [Pseudomonadota bacterium]